MSHSLTEAIAIEICATITFTDAKAAAKKSLDFRRVHLMIMRDAVVAHRAAMRMSVECPVCESRDRYINDTPHGRMCDLCERKMHAGGLRCG